MSMSLSEVIESVRSGGRPDYEDLRYAICALEALAVLDGQAFMRLAEAEREDKRAFMITSAQWQWVEHFERRKRALAAVPKAYVGWNNDPDNPEFLARREQSIRLVNKMMERKPTT